MEASDDGWGSTFGSKKRKKEIKKASRKTEEIRGPKFSEFLTSPVIAITVARLKTFHVHSTLLSAESERFSKALSGDWKEATTKSIDLEDEDADLFGFFVEYLYRDQSILSRKVEHNSEYVTLARLYALGERLMAKNFQALSFWRFAESLRANTEISEKSIFQMLRIAGTEITERSPEDPMRAQIFWYGGAKITKLRNSGSFKNLLRDVPDLGNHLCLSVLTDQPSIVTELQIRKFAPEGEVHEETKPEVSLLPEVSEEGGQE